MIEDLLPPGVASAETFEDDLAAAPFGGEASLLGRTTPGRAAEFATARACARLALRRLGFAETAILRGEGREPLWPEGIVGSITHCAGYRAAAVAHASEFLAIGIDAEPHLPLPDGVAKHVLLPEERAWIAAAPPGIHRDRLVFSAKESVYKAWFPRARHWLGFHDARITLGPDPAGFTAELLLPPPRESRLPRSFSGRFTIQNSLVLTAATIPG